MNFSYLKDYQEFKKFADECILAEESLAYSPVSAAFNARRALEQAVKWMYLNDVYLKMPYKDTLAALMTSNDFVDIVPEELRTGIRYVRELGNKAAHTNDKITYEQALVSLKFLYAFVDWIVYVYGSSYTQRKFNTDLIPKKAVNPEQMVPRKDMAALEARLKETEKQLEDLIKENEENREKGTAQRETQKHTQPYELPKTEWDTRKILIDEMLENVGWDFDRNVFREYSLHGMPTTTGTGYADYVLQDNSGRIVGVVEAKKTSVQPEAGRNQVEEYANAIEKQTGLRPIMFYTNGFDTYLWDDAAYPPRRVAGFPKADEIGYMIQQRSIRKPLRIDMVNLGITDRTYQLQALESVFETLKKSRRKALLVMATGTGKTRVAVSLVDCLTRTNWVKNALFMADRTELIRQAKQSFTNLLPNLTTCNLLENKEDPYSARMVFSTYQTMIHAIDEDRLEDGTRLFSPSHFQLIILDESHRSIYHRYRQIIDYFDAIFVGLTATPKEDINKNTYEVFDLENGVPTYAYEMKQGVADGYLVPPRVRRLETEFLKKGIQFDLLSDEDKDEFEQELGSHEDVEARRMNRDVFNENTIRLVLETLMKDGIKIDDGDKLAKTIIFAGSTRHAQEIVRVFDRMYPNLGKDGFAKVITTNERFKEKLIDDFKTPNAYPQIAVSVDMLDTGVDVPEVCNLVFFKQVNSKSKFWQMVGRGTRICKNLFGPDQDKKEFLIFDCGDNVERFMRDDLPPEPSEKKEKSLSQRIFEVQLNILQELESRKKELNAFERNFMNELRKELIRQVMEIPLESFEAQLVKKEVMEFQSKTAWNKLSDLNYLDLKNKVARLVTSTDKDQAARRFDFTVYQMEDAFLKGQSMESARERITLLANKLETECPNVEQVKKKLRFLRSVQKEAWWKDLTLEKLAEIREKMRELMKFLPSKDTRYYYLNVEDKITVHSGETDSLAGADMVSDNYRDKVSSYLKSHLDDASIEKIRTNQPITDRDIQHLENILWEELGNQDEYRIFFGEKPLPALVRELTGISPEAVNAAFAKFMTDYNLNQKQMDFVQMLMKYIQKNGLVANRQTYMEEPFRQMGSIPRLFDGKTALLQNILSTADEFKNRLQPET